MPERVEGPTMIILGVDAHKRTHTLVAIDDAGRRLGERTVAATTDGHLQALQWASCWAERRFAIEDCHHVSRRLEPMFRALVVPLDGSEFAERALPYAARLAEANRGRTGLQRARRPARRHLVRSGRTRRAPIPHRR